MDADDVHVTQVKTSDETKADDSAGTNLSPMCVNEDFHTFKYIAEDVIFLFFFSYLHLSKEVESMLYL